MRSGKKPDRISLTGNADTSETSASVYASCQFINVVAHVNAEAVPIDNAIGKYFEPRDIGSGKNTVQFGDSIRVIVDADAVNAHIELLDLETVHEHTISEFGDDVVLDLVTRQPL